MADSLHGEILNHLCRSRDYMLMIIGLLGVFLILTGIGFTVIAPGTSAYVINAFNLIGLSVCFVFFGTIVIYCYRIAPQRAHT